MSAPRTDREPGYFLEVRNRLVNADIRLAGVTENWVMPAARYVARGGFGEETWIPSSPDTVLAWRIDGPDIECHAGAARGQVGHSGKRLLTLQSKGTPSHYTATSDISFGHVCIPDGLLFRVAEELRLTGSHGVLRDDLVFFSDDLLFEWVGEYAERSLAESPPSRIEMEGRALLIVDRLLNVHHAGRRRIEKGGLSARKLRLLTDYLMAHLAEDVALPELAAIADLSPYHFCRAFKQSTGLPPHAWLTARRVERAQGMMLAHKAMGLTEIALSVGYSTQAAFGVAFRRVTGVTPGQWRRERAG